MAALVRDTGVITTIQPAETPVVGSLDEALDNAYEFGVTDIGATVSLPPFPGYADQSPATQKIIREAAASLLFATLAPVPWVNVTLVGAWVDEPGFQKAQYRKEFPDIVRLRGMVQSGTGIIGNLPVGFRPPADVKFSIVNGSTTSPGYITVEAATGDIVYITGTTSQIGLDGICFSVAP